MEKEAEQERRGGAATVAHQSLSARPLRDPSRPAPVLLVLFALVPRPARRLFVLSCRLVRRGWCATRAREGLGVRVGRGGRRGGRVGRCGEVGDEGGEGGVDGAHLRGEGSRDDREGRERGGRERDVRREGGGRMQGRGGDERKGGDMVRGWLGAVNLRTHTVRCRYACTAAHAPMRGASCACAMVRAWHAPLVPQRDYVCASRLSPPERGLCVRESETVEERLDEGGWD
jgi:hypothetical protein